MNGWWIDIPSCPPPSWGARSSVHVPSTKLPQSGPTPRIHRAPAAPFIHLLATRTQLNQIDLVACLFASLRQPCPISPTYALLYLLHRPSPHPHPELILAALRLDSSRGAPRQPSKLASERAAKHSTAHGEQLDPTNEGGLRGRLSAHLNAPHARLSELLHHAQPVPTYHAANPAAAPLQSEPLPAR
ncbi:uncharacterized protein BKA78DRAFT_72345 [Phyllosticta capitalensis]|uniref:uncharacterized protein n=1 Tax=Phyllosticta capitalensis TaxID=121624 RepID=UPI00312E6ED0